MLACTIQATVKYFALIVIVVPFLFTQCDNTASFGGDGGDGAYLGRVYNTTDSCDPDSDDELTALVAEETLAFNFGDDVEIVVGPGSSEAATIAGGSYQVEIVVTRTDEVAEEVFFEIFGDGWYFYGGCEDPVDE